MPSPDGTAAGPAALARVVVGAAVVLLVLLAAVMVSSRRSEAAPAAPPPPAAVTSVLVAELGEENVNAELLASYVTKIKELPAGQLLYLDLQRAPEFDKDVTWQALQPLADVSGQFAVAASKEDVDANAGAVLLLLAGHRVATRETLDAAVAKADGGRDEPWCGPDRPACQSQLDEWKDAAPGPADLSGLVKAVNPSGWVSVAFAGEDLTAPPMPTPSLGQNSVSPEPTDDPKPGGSGGPDLQSIFLALLVVVLAVLAFVYYRSRRDQHGDDSGRMDDSGGMNAFDRPNLPYRAPYAEPTARSHRAGAGAGAGAGRVQRSLVDDADQPLSSLSTASAASGNRRPERTPERYSRPASQESTPVCRLFTELDPDGYVDYDGVLYRAWWDGSEEPPAVGDPVRLEDRGTGIYYAVRQF